MDFDVRRADKPVGVAVLLHPHPDYGGSRFHPFVGGLFGRLPEVGFSAIRFDFSSAHVELACQQVVAAIQEAADRPIILVGYSFGAGIASMIDDRRVAAWYLLAPPVSMLASAAIGPSPRPKAVVVPERDQFSSPEAVAGATGEWVATTVTVVPDVDHFLGRAEPFVDRAVAWFRCAPWDS